VIRLESITIKEFRGIRDMTLDFKGKNFAICGPNGTGKSGIVDALEFALTGTVSRLSGEGSGEVSLKAHGPHVDSRAAPDKARVAVKLTIPSLGKTITVERSVKAPGSPRVTPSDAGVLDVLRQVESHPEIVLSRRELIRYVLATPGKRAEEVQALLHLDQVDRVRAGLQKIANACERPLSGLGTSAADARANLLRALGIAELTKDKVLAATNAQRATLGLLALTELTDTTSLRDGLATARAAEPQRISKIQALADIRAAREVLAEIVSITITARVVDAEADVRALATDPEVATGVAQESFYVTGMGLIANHACPFCDSAWDLDDLRRHVQIKIDHLKEVSRRRQAAEAKAEPLVALLRKIQSALDFLVRYGDLARPPLTIQTVRDHSVSCAITATTLAAFLPLADTIAALATVSTVPPAVLDAVAELEKVVSELPEPTKQDSAREWLSVAQERLEVYRSAMRQHKTAKEQAQRARQVSDIYSITSDKVLVGIYADVQRDFASLYGFVNRDDEDKFKAQLVPSMGKLGFDVDFYGRGFFPPGAYHSEGHQDSMGICLYLALMRHLQGGGFSFAVLDDVLMSVDAGHRREVCTLLKTEFSNTQFIMTTHDPIWLRHMKTEALIGNRAAIQFKGWSIDQGPAQWDERDVWAEIGDYLKQNDVRASAGLLRHYLEYVAAELCHRLRAQPEYRGDAQYQLGELLPAAIRQMRRLYSLAKDSANSWNQKEVIVDLSVRESSFAALADGSKAEEWQVNVAVHFNSWENLGSSDFAPVAEAFRNLLGGFCCAHCEEFLRVTPDRETCESLRCDCGKTNINLVRKK
jgi:recombinational DNA repair ATPase RecF